MITQYISTTNRERDILIRRSSDGIIIEAYADTDYGKSLLRKIVDKERTDSANNIFYTLGPAESYEKYLKEDMFAKKLGQKDDYIGGSIFRTKNAAKQYKNKHKNKWKIYGVICNNEDVDFTNETKYGFGNLLTDSFLVKL